MLSSLLYWLTGHGYYVLTGSILSLSDTGALRALQNLISPIIQMITALGLLFMPWVSGRFARHGRESLKRGVLAFSATSTLLAILYLLVITPLREILFQLLYGGKYIETSWLLPYLALLPVIAGLTSGWLVGLRILKRTSLVFIVDIIGATLTLTVGVILVNALGLTGAVIGMVLSSASRIVVLPSLWAKAMETQREIDARIPEVV